MNTPHSRPLGSFLKSSSLAALVLVFAACPLLPAQPAAGAAPAGNASGGATGIFEGHNDIGIMAGPDNTVFDAGKKTYAITGGGNNIWATADAFQYVWKKVSGNVSLAADIAFLDNPARTPAEPHRKACLMIRQSLDADSPYIDLAGHGVGLTSLQFREDKGGITREERVSTTGPVRLRIEKHGDTFTVFMADKNGQDLRFAGGSYTMKFQEPFYIGLAVCAHNGNDTSPIVETAVFSNVELKTDLPAGTPKLYSTLQTQNNGSATAAGDRSILFVTPGVIEGPLWQQGNTAMIYSSGGHLYHLPIAVVPQAAGTSGSPPTTVGQPTPIDTGSVTNITAVHAFSPDGTLIVFTDQPAGQPPAVYTVPVAGGTPKKIVANGTGFSLSPDGKTLVFSGERNGQTDILTIAADGTGMETNLTKGTGKNTSPQFIRSGAKIIFASDRSGTTQVWMMNPDGTEPTQITKDDNNNVAPRLSSNDGRLIFLTYPKDATDFSKNQIISVRSMTGVTSMPLLQAKVLGNTATAPTWGPDNAQPTYVGYSWVY